MYTVAQNEKGRFFIPKILNVIHPKKRTVNILVPSVEEASDWHIKSLKAVVICKLWFSRVFHMFNSAPHPKPSRFISWTGIFTIILFIPNISFIFFSWPDFSSPSVVCQGRTKTGKYLYAENFHLILCTIYSTAGFYWCSWSSVVLP